MLSIKINVNKINRSIRDFQKRVPVAMRGAVRNTSKKLLGRIIEKTPAPPTPIGQIYIRTGRLREGWQPAANALGMGVPSVFMPPPRPSYYGSPPRDRDLSGRGVVEIYRPGLVSFKAINRVPYALFVEEVGPKGHAPVKMVARSIMETEGDFNDEIKLAWASL